MVILETPRLRLREATLDDAPFALRLVNEPGWLRHISDPGVRSLEQARAWVQSRLIDPCRQQGHGFWVVERRSDAEALGICGLFRRPSLRGPDLGYALLAEHEGQGHASEAAEACVALARERWGWTELLAITSPSNPRSERLLHRLGFADEGLRLLDGHVGPTRLWRKAL